jgi:hypothetical protein
MIAFVLITLVVYITLRVQCIDEEDSRIRSRHYNEENNKDNDLLVFIYITSGLSHINLRNVIRSTWLQSCIDSFYCDYAFFIDQSYNHSLLSQNHHHDHHNHDHHDGDNKGYDNDHYHYHYHHEYQTYHDIVYRDSCDLMLRHPDYINYSNSPPSEENIHHKIINDTGDTINTITYPDYPLRILYKIDWKICFLKYTYKINKVAKYHIFVEDDSYVCMNHLLYQLQRIEDRVNNINRSTTSSSSSSSSTTSSILSVSFRTGTTMYDGFDDSSTIMTKDIALLFMKYYPNHNFNCDFLVHSNNDNDYNNISSNSRSQSSHEYMFLSWGNSWSKKHCNWSKMILDKAHIHVNYPNLNCNLAFKNIITSSQQQELVISNNNNNNNNSDKTYRCYEHPLILHHPHADQVILGDHYMIDINHHHLYNHHDYHYHNTTHHNNSSSNRNDSSSNHDDDNRTQYYEHHKSRYFSDKMLFIDKIKEPTTMHILANLEKYGSIHRYDDYSSVFLSKDDDGWISIFKGS